MNNNLSVVETEEKKEGKIVAHQYPEKAEFNDIVTAEDLEKKHGHLKRIDADSREDYKALTTAIKEVSAARLHVKKEESFAKDPLNEFRAKIIQLAKDLIIPIQTFEETLKAEKKRIDDIKAERLAAQQKLWQDNLQIIRAKGQNLFGRDLASLQGELQVIDACNLGDFDFGDYIEDAKCELANARVRTEQAIAMEEERLKIEQEKAERKQREAEAAEAQRIKDEEAAAAKKKQDEEIAALKRQLEETQAEADKLKAESEQQIDIEEMIEEKANEGEEGFDDDIDDSGAVVMGNAEIPTSAGMSIVGQEEKQFIAKSFDSVEDSPKEEIEPSESKAYSGPYFKRVVSDKPAVVLSEEDLGDYNDFMAAVKDLIAVVPKVENKALAEAVTRVAKNLDSTLGYLERTLEEQG